jgi:hypothetical protein
MGTLYYGDNLDILRRHLKDETVDLVYLDPPFNSAQNYNAFFHEKDGTDAAKPDPRLRRHLELEPGNHDETLRTSANISS